MKYRVIWSAVAAQQLTTIWLAARDRIRVRGAADDLDAVLATNPARLGESRDGSNRIVFYGPLVVRFDVDPDTQSVVVRRVDRQ